MLLSLLHLSKQSMKISLVDVVEICVDISESEDKFRHHEYNYSNDTSSMIGGRAKLSGHKWSIEILVQRIYT